MALTIGITVLAVLGIGWLIGRLRRPAKVNELSKDWIQAKRYDRQRPD